MPALPGLALAAHIGLGHTTTTGLNYLIVQLVLTNDTRIDAQIFNNTSGSNALLGQTGTKLTFVRNIGNGVGTIEWTNGTGSSKNVKGVQLFVNSSGSMSGALALTPVLSFAAVEVPNSSVLRLFNLEMTLNVGVGDNLAGLREAIVAGAAKASVGGSKDLYMSLLVDGVRTSFLDVALSNTLFTRSDGRLTYNGAALEYTPTGGATREISGFDMELTSGTPGTNYLFPPTPAQAYVDPDQTLRITSSFFELNG